MRRPLLTLMVVLILGIMMIHSSEALRTFTGMFRPPGFRVSMEEDSAVGKDQSFSGTVRGFVPAKEGYVLLVHGGKNIGSVRVYLKEENAEKLPALYDRVRFSGTFFLFEKAMNPGEFDVRSYYDHLGYYLGFTLSDFQIERKSRFRWTGLLFTMKGKMQKIIRARMTASASSVLLSILFSDAKNIQEDVYDSFTGTGLLRLIQMSGLYFSFISGLIFSLFRRITHSTFVSSLAALTALLFVGFFTGFSDTFLRAFLIFLIRTSAGVFHRKYDPLTGISTAVIFLILRHPGVIYTTPLLYFLSVMYGIHLIYEPVEKLFFRKDDLFSPVLRALSAGFSLYPVQLLSNYRMHLLTPVLLVLFTPFLQLFSSLGFLGAVLGLLAETLPETSECFLNFLSEGSLTAASGIFWGIQRVVSVLNGLPVFTYVSGKANGFQIAFVLSLQLAVPIGLRYLFLREKKRPERKMFQAKRKHFALAAAVLFLLIVLELLSLHRIPLSKNTGEIDMLYVGQGDGILIRGADGKNFMVDGGSVSRENLGEDTLLPVFSYYGITKIDAWLISHGDRDHTSGMITLIEKKQISVGKILIPGHRKAEEEFEEIITLAGRAGIPVYRVYAGGIFTSGRNSFYFFSPDEGEAGEGNELSMVFKYAAGDFSMLFTGDIGMEREEKLLSLWGEKNLSADLLKVPHHGSRYSSSDAFLSAVHPSEAFVSYGIGNVYGHPTEEALQRYEKQGISVRKTGETGELVYRFRLTR